MIHLLAYEEEGYSLIESIVAIALLLTVLVPVSAFLGSLATKRISKQKIEALAIAQASMENAIQLRDFTDKSVPVHDGKWILSEEYILNGDLVTIMITVAKPGRSRPGVSLQTARLLPPLNPY